MENKNRQYIIRLIFILAVSVVLSACSKVDEPKEEEHPQVPEQAIEQFSIMEANEGKLNWVLDAKNAKISDSTKKVILNFPIIKFFQDGKYISTLTAKRGRISTDNYDIWGEDDCLLETAEGERLETRNLHYRSDIKKVVTDAKVKLIRKNEVITGKGMEATPDLESIIIRNQKVEVRNIEQNNEAAPAK